MKIIERVVHPASDLPSSLESVLDTIRSVYEPERVILYGSAARGEPWHDLDLLIVVDTGDRLAVRQKKLALAMAGRQDFVSTDLLVLTPSEVSRQVSENRFFLVDEILHKGQTVYERVGRS